MSEFIKYGKDNIKHMLTHLLNTLYIEGDCPDQWATGIIGQYLKREIQSFREITEQ